ncbi:hypothetical protein NP493_1108g00020 [Ridgeia piscesae]|uniref:Uncharacterized protein n=1 Tax=Ridgeia piscesae TaxID=27915 RepID=A0AAD9KG73_RIDPI|nr:hypothetical protein NP493_1108g00020 [Ridgeia piscesae]
MWCHTPDNEFTGRTSVICRCEVCFKVHPSPTSTTPTLTVTAIRGYLCTCDPHHTNCHTMETPKPVTEPRCHTVPPAVCVFSNISWCRCGRPHWPTPATLAGRAGPVWPILLFHFL